MPGDDLTGRTRHCWRVEGWENGEWGMVASASDTLPEAQRKKAGVDRRSPGHTMRIVRETTSYIVEEPEADPCPCCTFGNHTETCTCDGCCHPVDCRTSPTPEKRAARTSTIVRDAEGQW
jgi:hypothetical protein